MAKNLDCTKAKQKISLVKVPPEVLRASQTVLESSTSATSSSATSDPTIGKIVEEVDLLNNDPSSSKQYFFEMADGSRHKLNITQQCAPLNVFSETKQGKLEVEGKIVRVVNMEPSIGDFKAYSQSVGERTRIAAAKTKRIKVIDIGNDAASKAWEAASQAVQNVETIKKQLADHLRKLFKNFKELKGCMDVLRNNSSDVPVKSMKNQTIKEQIIEDVNQLFLKLEELEERFQALQLSKVSDKKSDANAASGSQPASTDLKEKGKSKEVRKKGKKNLPRKS
ncbi:uncharacterized protein LOC121976591 isoform X2 [Zingiber officinale]|uniref:uncharacterized protein LOC121976591 isoform X2 n=1 Tax=Zingiber officinale TaxID=94328 RepID=UPI001C4AF4A5|nr:uncharacterized protein LOC121976591 isoform X2 [Zingiber officinale]